MDRLYTSVKIANWLLQKNITIVRTAQKGRVGFPEEVFDTKNREVLSKTCHFEKDKKDLCFSSYNVQTKSKAKKNVVILSKTNDHCQDQCIVAPKTVINLNFKSSSSMISRKVEQILLIK